MHNDWIACIVVLLSLSPTFSESCFHTKDEKKGNLRIKDSNLVIQNVTSDAGIASIDCPDLKDDEENIHISLHKESELHSTDLKKTQVLNISETKQRFRVYIRNESVHYLIDIPQVNDTGLYNCTVVHRAKSRTTQTFLLVKDPLQSCLHEGRSLSQLLLAAGCGLLALYNLIATTVSCYFGWKLKRRDTYQPDYFNTKPGEFSRTK